LIICEDAKKRRSGMPSWLKKELPDAESVRRLSSYLKDKSVETVCVNSRCPNISECYSSGNVSFLILGNICTRGCLFCAIKKGLPGGINPEEPEAVAAAVRGLGLKYIVITSVTRDDIPDKGSGHYAKTVKAIKKASPEVMVETLVPDFGGDKGLIDRVIDSGVDVLSHNIETTPGLYPRVRPGFDYARSLGILSHAAFRGKAAVKSGFMVGLGESRDETERLMRDIRATGCDFLTIGQYLRPKNSRLEVREYIPPERFSELKESALALGFKKAASGPFVRSSYRAGEFFKTEDL